MPSFKKLITSGSDASLNSLIASSITGSLHGNADTSTTASYALNIGSVSGYTYTQVSPSPTWTIEHNLGTQTPIITVYDSNYDVVIPNTISNQDTNTTIIGFTYSTTGYATISSGDGVSRNNIGTVNNATTASYVNITGSGITVNYNGSQIQLTGSAAGGGATVTISDTIPVTASHGDLWYNSNLTTLNIYYDDLSSQQWVEVGPGASSSPVTVSTTAPALPTQGNLWYNSDTTAMLVYYEDQNSSQWVEVTSNQNNTIFNNIIPSGSDMTAGQVYYEVINGKKQLFVV